MSLNKASEIHTTILDSITEGVFTVDANWRITSFNRAAEKITGIPRERAIGQPCRDIFRASICEQECSLHQTIETGSPIIGRTVKILDAQGNRKPISISTAILRDRNGDVIGGVETFRDLTMVEELRKQVKRNYCCEDILTCNYRIRQIFEILPAIAETSSTVLIEGETGTGKELFARAIHNLSLRGKKPFVAVNCGALPDTLLESELFGYKAGAFTDARKDKPGRVAAAEGGTLFLDEIGDMPLEAQAKLLRVLETREVFPLGATQAEKVDVRVVCATHRDLAKMQKEHRFRGDLFARLNDYSVTLPPLRERKEDIYRLAVHMLHRHNRPDLRLSFPFLTGLLHYDFPYNVRELEAVIKRAIALTDGPELRAEHLTDAIREQMLMYGKPAMLAEPDADVVDPAKGQRPTAPTEEELRGLLVRHRGNVAAIGRELGKERMQIHRWMKRYGISPDEYREG